MTPEIAILCAIAVPLVGAAILPLVGKWPNIREAVSLATAAVLLMFVAAIAGPVAEGATPSVTLFEMMPGFDIVFTVEPLGLLFACVASFLWPVTTIYAIGYMRGHHEKNQTRFFVCFAIAISSAMAIAFSGNLLTLFVFYEVLTLSTYPLVTHAGTDKAKEGGRTYLGILITTSMVFLMPAILWTFHLAGTLDFVKGGILAGKADTGLIGILLLLYVFGIGKAALMPVHRWLPAAMVAPTPVSALLHAVAVVKAGVFSVLKIAVYVFGIDLLGDLNAADFLKWMAAATLLIGSLVAMRQDNLKRRLAYSTIAQLSYIILGAMMATSLGVIGGGLHIAMHAFGKITLFFCAGSIMVAAHKTEVSQLDGLGKAMPYTFFAFMIGAMSIIGLPPFGGMWSKWYLAMGALEGGDAILVGVLMVSSVLNVAYLLPIPIRAFFCKAKDDTNGHHKADYGEAPAASVFAQSLTAFGCLVLFIYPAPVLNLLGLLVGP